MHRILIIKTSSMGDIIHCLPVIADIHAALPQAHIDWVVEENFADIPRMHAGIHQIFMVNIRRWRKALFNRQTWAEIKAFKRSLPSYDAVIDCQGLTKSALITRLTKGITHGFDWHSGRDPFASIFYAKNHAVSLQQDAVARNRELVARALGYEIPQSAPNYGITIKDDISERLLAIESQADYIIALHGTSRDSKLWPAANWVALGKALAEKKISLVLPWANASEFARANEIAHQLTNAHVLPKLSIAEVAHVIAKAHAAVGVDTGLSHLAAALNIPIVAIYTDTNPALNGVIAGNVTSAVNLGNVGIVPSADEVIEAFFKITI